MKAEREHPTARYYSETVFRSAERLAASRPVTKRSHRGKFFAGGLVVGVLLGAGGRELWIRAHPAPATPPSETVSSAPTKPRAQVVTNSAQPALPPPPAAVATPPQIGDAAAPAAEVDASPLSAPGAGNVAARTLPLSAEAKAADESFAATIGSRVAWYGVMSSSRTPMHTIEFSFGEKKSAGPDRVSGVVRLGSVTANVVVGDVVNGAVVLRETEKIWTKTDEVQAGDPLLQMGRKFSISLPDPTAQELNGTWTLGDESGTVRLTVLRRVDL